MRSLIRVIRTAVVCAAGVSAGCGDGGGTAPRDGRTRAAMSALRLSSVVEAVAATDVSIRVFYLRGSEAQVDLTRVTIALDNTAQQQVPVSVDITGCLSDTQRTAATATDCPAVVELTLLRGAEILDVESAGPVALRSGEQTTIAQPIVLREVANIRITPASPSVPIGQAITLTGTPLDATGAAVAGRSVQWSVANAAIARVDTAGVVTGVTPGQTLVSATAGGRTSGVTVTVLSR
jgi:Big-like domain-containing protein